MFHTIKSIIEKKAGIHSYDHLFYYNGNLISDTRSIDSLSISVKEATLQMVFEPNDGAVSFSVETPAKTIIKVQVRCLHTILDVKKIVEDTTNLPNEDWDLFIGRINATSECEDHI